MKSEGLEPIKEIIMKRVDYMKRATNRFLNGTGFKIPAQAVEAGLRSLTDWVQILSEERESDQLEALSRDSIPAHS